MANGQLPASALAPIPGTSPRPGGKPLLRKDCAALYNGLAAEASGRGVSMALNEGAMRRAYRELSAQRYARSYWCSRGACGNAAVPGTSNHGLGTTVDVQSGYQRAYIDRHGAPWGWSKRWSDAPHEWWHLRCDPRRATRKPGTMRPTLRYGMRGKWVSRLQIRLREKGYRSVKVDGHFGRSTLRAVKLYQRRISQRADGIVGAATWRALTKR